MTPPLRVCVIGTGFGTAVQVPAFQAHPDTEVVAIVSAREERARDAAARFGITHAFADYRDALALPDVDIVSIASPPVHHHRQVLDAIAAGKHVLCEKQLAMSVGEARALVAAQEAAGVTGMVDFEFRWVPGRFTFRRLVDEGVLGALLSVDVVGVSPALAKADAAPWSWLFEAETGGGFLAALGSHTIDALRWWFGEIVAVTGFTTTRVPARPGADGVLRRVTADDGFGFVARLENGAWVHVVCHLTAGAALTSAGISSGARITAVGTRGMLVLDATNRLWLARDGGPLEPVAPDPVPLPVAVGSADPRLGSFLVVVDRLVAGIRAGTSPSPHFRDGLAVQQVLEAVQRSQDPPAWLDPRSL